MVFGSFERMVALRYLRARRKEGFISVIAGFSLLGIALGVATLIIVMAVMNGFREELVDRILGLNGHVQVYGYSDGLQDWPGIADDVSALPGVTAVFPMIEGQALVTHRGSASGAALRGIRPADFLSREAIAADLIMPDRSAFAGIDAIAIGTRMASRLNVTVGDSLTLIAPQGAATAFGTVPRSKSYEIVGIFDVGMFEYDSTFVFMPLEAAQVFLQLGDGVTNLDVFLDRPEALSTQRPAIEAAIGGRGRLWDWQDANSSFLSALDVERNVMFIILTLIILVAAFNVISGLVMLVKDKGQDIAILRTMGATRGMIMRVFFLTGASIGVVGTVAGFALGVAFTLNIEAIRQGLMTLTGVTLFDPEIYFLSQLPASIDWSEVWMVVGMSLGLSFLATLYPSWRAARLDPVEALRYE